MAAPDTLFPAEPAEPVQRGTHRSVAAVYPLVPTRSFDEALSYTVPEELDALGVGDLVRIPLGPSTRLGIVADVGVQAPEGVTLRPLTGRLDHPGVPAPLVRLAEWTARTCGCATTRALALVVPPGFGAHGRAATEPRRRLVRAARRMAATDGHPPEGQETLTARAREVLAGMPDAWQPIVRLEEELSTTRATIEKLASAGLVELRELPAHSFSEPQDGRWAQMAAAGRDTPPKLTAEQATAVAACLAPLEAAGTGDAFDPATLLMGITGSGKTEVYLHVIARVLDAGRSAIVLVPEIALTPQTAGRFVRRFGATVEVLHSGLTPAQRAAAWSRIRDGHRQLVVGPRSALFAPLADVGAIVVDEEHDSSYKQDSEPRYDARRVAWKRAHDAGAVLILGSATPRPEAWHGVSRRVRLLERPGGAQLAPVDIVDLREHADSYPLTDPLVAALDVTMRRGRKAIVLHNRRGYANAWHCRSCGVGVRCDDCDIAMTVHGTGRQRLVCHHCGVSRDLPGHCPHCQSADMARLGAGAERIERELAARFDVRVVRVDADNARRAGGVTALLDAFAAPGPAILTGTQMIAKGHDFPDVELAVLVDADTSLAIPDFRAEERSFSLVAQLAGRAGRSIETADHSRVLVQTWDPDARFIHHARSHDVEGFLSSELERRAQLGWPPFQRLVRVLLTAPEQPPLDTWGEAVAAGIESASVGQVLGPAPLVRIAGRQRCQVLVKTERAAELAGMVRSFLRNSAAERGRQDVRIVLDVDPQSLI